MSNILNSIIANQSINMPDKQEKMPVFTFDSNGKTKPMEDKGKLLPSKIFGSPVEYAKDLKKDIVSIGRAAKGQANDHELGRINDLGMKIGGLALASYLFVKNPLKLSKAMEFAGLGTFFASMALWPKLAIQAPIKARTGVDIHQKYIDSQGRKKMLYQDPQYVLTDLYDKETLNKMGKKLGVDENLPDRDNFIKQRAQKTAIQGNTLWMMTAGLATPLMSALGCNRLEKPIAGVIEKMDMASSEAALNKQSTGFISKLKQSSANKAFNKFINENADKTMDDELIKNLTSKISSQANSASFQDIVKKELQSLKNTVNIDKKLVVDVLGSNMPSLTEAQKSALDEAIKSNSINEIAKVISNAAGGSKKDQVKLSKKVKDLLEQAQKSQVQPKLSEVSEQVMSLYDDVASFASRKGVLDKYINARVGNQSGTYIANQWGRVGDKLIKSLKLNNKDLKALSQGNMDVLTDKINALVSNPEAYDDVVSKLSSLIDDYDKVTGSEFTKKVAEQADDIYNAASNTFKQKGFKKLADKVSSDVKTGTVKNVINENTSERILGAKSSFYRLLQTLDVFKKADQKVLQSQIENALKEQGKNADKASVEKLTKACKDILVKATTTDHIEKLKTAGFELSSDEYKTVMNVLFGEAKNDSAGLAKYKKSCIDKIANWQNNMTADLSRRVTSQATNSANAIERNNIVGKPVKDLVQDFAKNKYNSNKWLKIFGGAMLVLTAITLTAGLALGRKGKTEKQVEAESKVNG